MTKPATLDNPGPDARGVPPPDLASRGTPAARARERIAKRIAFTDEAGLNRDPLVDPAAVDAWVKSSWIPLAELDDPTRLSRDQLQLLFRTETRRRPFDSGFLREALQVASAEDPSVPVNAVHPHTTATIQYLRATDMRNVLFGEGVFRDDTDWKQQIAGNPRVPDLPLWVLEHLVKPTVGKPRVAR